MASICDPLKGVKARASAAWPPRLKIPTRCPVLPKLRVGMASAVFGLDITKRWW
jgi:hypothetical protein